MCVLFSVAYASANPTTAAIQTTSWLDRFLNLFIFRIFAPEPPAPIALNSPTAADEPQPEVSFTCSVTPIPPLDGAEAQNLENATTPSGRVDLSGLRPATATALARFESRVEKLGGTFTINSAYRPPAYQAHLEVVWDKWQQLRNNDEPGCAIVKAQVEDEFQHHQLLATQRPVPVSDHTRGLAFDADILLPRRRFSVDRLAHVAGLMRPAIARDPVHFRLMGARRD